MRIARHVVLDAIDAGRVYLGTREKSIQALLASAKAGTMDIYLKEQANNKNKGDQTVSRATLYN